MYSFRAYLDSELLNTKSWAMIFSLSTTYLAEMVDLDIQSFWGKNKIVVIDHFVEFDLFNWPDTAYNDKAQ